MDETSAPARGHIPVPRSSAQEWADSGSTHFTGQELLKEPREPGAFGSEEDGAVKPALEYMVTRRHLGLADITAEPDHKN